jgi:hypothetical protein
VPKLERDPPTTLEPSDRGKVVGWSSPRGGSDRLEIWTVGRLRERPSSRGPQAPVSVAQRSERVPGRAFREFEIANIGAEPQPESGTGRHHDHTAIAGGDYLHVSFRNSVATAALAMIV